MLHMFDLFILMAYNQCYCYVTVMRIIRRYTSNIAVFELRHVHSHSSQHIQLFSWSWRHSLKLL